MLSCQIYVLELIWGWPWAHISFQLNVDWSKFGWLLNPSWYQSWDQKCHINFVNTTKRQQCRSLHKIRKLIYWNFKKKVNKCSLSDCLTWLFVYYINEEDKSEVFCFCKWRIVKNSWKVTTPVVVCMICQLLIFKTILQFIIYISCTKLLDQYNWCKIWIENCSTIRIVSFVQFHVCCQSFTWSLLCLWSSMISEQNKRNDEIMIAWITAQEKRV